MPNPNVPDGVTVSRASRACYGEFSPRGQHAPTNRLLLGRELRRRRDLPAKRDEARDLVFGQGRHFFFPLHCLLDERSKFLLLALGPRFLARVEFGQHLTRK